MKIKKHIFKIIIFIMIVSIFVPMNILGEEINKDEFENISAPNILLAETNTGKILYEKNADERIYPASITKLITAIVVTENCKLNDIVTVTENAINSLPSGYVKAGLCEGEELTVENLLYVMLIPSANDAANALAEHVGGSIENFAIMMNSKATELGCIGTNFTNPSGLHQENHYTTTRDLFLISQAAISNNTIRNIIQTTKYTLPKTNKYSNTDRTFNSTNYMKNKFLTKYYCNYCIGGKTGYTEYAKNCVVVFAKKNEIELTAIVMGEDSKVKGQKFLDAKYMFEYIFDNYENINIINKNETYETIKIANGTRDTRTLKILYKDDIKILERKNANLNNIDKKVKYTNIKAPINKGDIIGNVTYKYEGIEYKTDLIASSKVEESEIFEKILIVLGIVLIIYIIYNLRKSNKNNKKYKNKNRKTKGKVNRIYYN